MSQGSELAQCSSIDHKNFTGHHQTRPSNDSNTTRLKRPLSKLQKRPTIPLFWLMSNCCSFTNYSFTLASTSHFLNKNYYDSQPWNYLNFLTASNAVQILSSLNPPQNHLTQAQVLQVLSNIFLLRHSIVFHGVLSLSCQQSNKFSLTIVIMAVSGYRALVVLLFILKMI